VFRLFRVSMDAAVPANVRKRLILISWNAQVNKIGAACLSSRQYFHVCLKFEQSFRLMQTNNNRQEGFVHKHNSTFEGLLLTAGKSDG
jgi:hypothetical protein